MGIYAQRYGSDGTPKGYEFRVNSYTEHEQVTPSVAGLAGGGFVVCWTSHDQDGSGGGIYAQRHQADGKPEGGEFRVNSYTQNDQEVPCVTGLADGGFVVCWESHYQDDFWSVIYAQRYQADGKPEGGEFRVNNYTWDDQQFPCVTGLADGGFVVCWDFKHLHGFGGGIYAQRYQADGKPEGGEFHVNSYTDWGQGVPSAAGLSDGGFVVCWHWMKWDCSVWGIYAHRYSAGGKHMSGEFQIERNRTGTDVSAAALSGGGFVVCWIYKYYRQDGINREVYGKRFPTEPLRHELRPFDLLQPEYDATVTDGKPTLTWQKASNLTIAYPWELEYTVYCDTLADFSTAKVKTVQADTSLQLPALELGTTYFWKVLAKTYYGDSLWSEPSAFFVSHTATGVEVEAVPGQFAVLANYPNPFNPSTTIRFELPNEGYVTVKIYDLSGRLVKTLLSGEQTAGTHTAVWDGTDDAGRKVAAGVYFYQLEFTDRSGARQVWTQKMSLVK